MRVGPIRKQAADVVALLSDPARCQVMLVTLPEETPVSEAIETAFAIEDRAGVALGPIVVNGCFEPLPAGVVGLGRRGDAPTRKRAAASSRIARRTTSRTPPSSASIRHDVQREQIDRLARRLPLAAASSCRSCSPPTSARPQVDVLADAFARGIEQL